MKILVFVKQVPDTDTVKLDPVTGNLRREGVVSTVNPGDLNAVEAALQLRELHGGTVTAVSMGPPQAAEALKKALALGCDDAFLLSDRVFGGADTLATAYTLSKAAEKIGNFDLLIFGRNSIDGDTAQTGPATAAFLDLPQVTLVKAMELQDSWLCCTRELADCSEQVRVQLPAVISVCREINTPRYPTLMNIMKASKKPLTVWSAADLEADPEHLGGKGSPSSTKKVFEPPKQKTDTVYFEGSPTEMASTFTDILEKQHLL